MLDQYEWENGAWQQVAGIPLSDRGFRHGMSAFETVLIHHGKLIFLCEHLSKLRHACTLLGLRQPPEQTAFAPITSHLSPLTPQTARIYVTAGDGSFRSAIGNGRIFLFVENVSPSIPPQTLNISATPHTPHWPGLKTGNYWPNIDANRSTQSDEVVLVNTNKHIISASLANLFAVIDGALLTPRVSSGARAGVMRDWVIACEDVIVSDFHPEQLRDATEIFLTNSGYGIAPIVSLEGKPLASQSLGQKLRNDYLKWLEKL